MHNFFQTLIVSFAYTLYPGFGTLTGLLGIFTRISCQMYFYHIDLI